MECVRGVLVSPTCTDSAVYSGSSKRSSTRSSNRDTVGFLPPSSPLPLPLPFFLSAKAEAEEEGSGAATWG